MKKRGTKLLCFFLAVLMVFSCVAVLGLTSAFAAGSVYCEDAAGWGTVYCYMWGSSSKNAEWPGVAMTKGSDGVYSCAVDGTYEKVIFNNNNGTQTDDLTFPGEGQCYNNSTGSWSAHGGSNENQGNPTNPSVDNPTTTGSDNTIYCANDAKWGSVNVYMWNSDSDKNAEWPGAKMKDIGDGVWEYTPSKSFKNVIFNEGGNNQTADLTRPSDKNCYNNSTSSWDVYSTSPVKITDFSSSIQSPGYTNCSIKFSTTAKSSEGALTYKYSVKGATGDSVLSEGAAATVQWVPTVVGKYTITVDVSDTAGNTNSRSMTFEINDPSKLETAFISAFTNSLGTNTQIKKDSNITFTMKALGGHTGNGLLFYKFIVTDPDGKGNVPYYTTSNAYTITPTKLGTYTIEAFVQNSNNDTVNETYTYSSVAEINETPDATNPEPQTSPATEPATNDPSGDQPTGPYPTDPGSNPGGDVSPTNTPSEEPTATPNPSLGDVNKDGFVNVTDATLIQKYVASMEPKNFDPDFADTFPDGRINIKDATVIQKYVARIITSI